MKKKYNIVEVESGMPGEIYVKASNFPEVNINVTKKQTIKYRTFSRKVQEYFSYHRILFNTED